MRRFFQSRLGLVIAIFISILLLAGIQQLGWLRPVEDVLLLVFRPVQHGLSATADRLRSATSYFHSLEELREENTALREEVSRLLAENSDVKRDLESIELAAEEKRFLTEHEYAGVVASVIGRGSVEQPHSVVINRGDADGVHVGYPVVTENGIIIGKVLDTNAYNAKALLLNDNNSQLSATIENEPRSRGLVNGEYGISLTMSLIPHVDTVIPAQLVVTSGLEPFIPPGLLIGRIGTVEKRDGELFQQATVTLLTDYERLTTVTVLLP